MLFLLKYIIISFVFLSMGFSIEKSKKISSNSGGSPLVNLQEIILDDDSENAVQRKRAHKRKRKIRPRRNGF